VFAFPAGLYFLFREQTDQGIFVILYGITAVYFAVRPRHRAILPRAHSQPRLSRA
jgi:hypothetical protein